MLSRDAIGEILHRLPSMDAVVLGCGLGQSEDTLEVVKAVLEAAECPVVLDADGINLIAAHKDILRRRKGITVLTPHEGEFARLGGALSGGREAAAISMARNTGCILVLKGPGTVITDGQAAYINPTGNPGMAVGGSGDVLAGIIGAFLGQGMGALEAAACGVFVHGLAGDICAGEMGQYGMLPSDMIRVLPRLLK
jgi:NAD(P)H-hydrate epimerase